MHTGIELAVLTAGTDGVPAPGSGSAGRSGHAVVRLEGRLDGASAPALTQRLREQLTTHGALVADVSGLRLDEHAAVHAFADAVLEAGEWPDVRLVLARPDEVLEALLVSSRVAQRVIVCPDVDAGLGALARRPDLVRAYWHFAVSAYAPGSARTHVRRVCERWSVDPEVCEAAEIVVTELVTNAVEHADSRSVVEVERRSGSFRMRVRDFDTTSLPEAVLPPPSSARGRGLAMVAAVSREWGVHHHSDGKTVWAEMATA